MKVKSSDGKFYSAKGLSRKIIRNQNNLGQCILYYRQKRYNELKKRKEKYESRATNNESISS